jgi:hypothetical protein
VPFSAFVILVEGSVPLPLKIGEGQTDPSTRMTELLGEGFSRKPL